MDRVIRFVLTLVVFGLGELAVGFLLGGCTAPLEIFESFNPLTGSLGAPNPDWSYTTVNGMSVPKYAQLDLVWPLFHAGRRNP